MEIDSTLVDALDVGLLVVEPETARIVDANERAERLFGYSADELTSMGAEALSADKPAYSTERAARLVDAAATGSPQRVEWRIKRANGELRWVEVRLAKAALRDAPYVVVEIRDITTYKVRERRLQLLARVTRHHLRNKLNVIHGYAQRLSEEDVRESSPVEQIRAATEDLLETTATVQRLKTATSGGDERRRPIHLPELVEDVVDDYRSERSDIAWTVESETEMWVSAADTLRTALEEAVANAVEHGTRSHDSKARRDATEPRVRITVTTTDDREYAVVRICNGGPPIPQVERDQLREQYEPDATSHGVGTGLWLMRTIVEALGGDVDVRREDGRNVVEFVLPRTDPRSEPSPDRYQSGDSVGGSEVD